MAEDTATLTTWLDHGECADRANCLSCLTHDALIQSAAVGQQMLRALEHLHGAAPLGLGDYDELCAAVEAGQALYGQPDERP